MIDTSTQPNDIKVIGESPYEVTEVLDRNLRTAVYRAVSSFGEPVILKRLKDLETSLHAQRAFSVFQKTRDHLKTAGIPDILYCDDEWKVSSFVEGLSGLEYADEHGGLTIPQICAFVQQALRPVGAYMDAGVVHGDLKPANLVVDINPDNMPDRVTPIDQEILGRVGQASLNPGKIYGTPRFMAPEQCLGQYHRTTDGFSLGVTALDLLATPRHGFQLGDIGSFDDTFHSLDRRAHNNWLKPNARAFLERHLATVAPAHEQTSRMLLEFVFSCVRQNSWERPQTAEEMRQMLPDIRHIF